MTSFALAPVPATTFPFTALVGHEALLRWNHPRRGLLVPGDFMRVPSPAARMRTGSS